MKKLLAMILAGTMVFSLAACGQKADEEDTEEEVVEEVEEEEEETKEAGPHSPTPGSITIGDYTLTAEHIPFDEPYMVYISNSPDADVLGNTLYVGDGKEKVKVYTLDGNTVSFSKELPISTRNGISVDGNGTIYADGGVFEAKVYDAEGNEQGKAPVAGYYYASKTEDFALAYFTGDDEVKKISGGASEPWVIKGMKEGTGDSPFSGINEIAIWGNTVLIGGSNNDGNVMAAYDTAGNKIMVSNGDVDGTLPNAVAMTDNGYMCSAVGDLNLIGKDGTVIGHSGTAKDLFGLPGTGWIFKFAPADDGSVLAFVLAYESGYDDAEILLYKISGF